MKPPARYLKPLESDEEGLGHLNSRFLNWGNKGRV